MRPFWSGNISFGLVNIPVNVYTATTEERVDLDMLHKTDLSRIKYKKVCADFGHEVPENEIVKAYEFEKDEYVILSKDDLAKVAADKSKSLDIQTFVPQDEIPTMYYTKPYYLEPGKGAGKAFALLQKALVETHRVAVIQVAFRNRLNLGVVEPTENGLLLNMLRYPEQIRVNEIQLPDVTVDKKELQLAVSLVDSLSAEFDPSQYKDTYREELMKIIAAKQKGVTIPVPSAGAAPPTKVIDLMEMLKKSLNQQKKPAPVKKPAAKAKTAARRKTTTARRTKRAS